MRRSLPFLLVLTAITGSWGQDAASLVRAGQPTVAEGIGEFALRVESSGLSDKNRDLLKRNILDILGCAIAALGEEPTRAARSVVDAFGGKEQSTLIGGGKTSVDRAAFYNDCLVRYVDFMDNFTTQGEVSHPADNFAPLLAVAEQQEASGEDFLLALAVAYQVECRLLEKMPWMEAGINNTTPQAFSVAAGAARLLKLSGPQAASAIALGGVDSVALAVIQAEPVSNWKGLASGDTSMRSVHNAYLAQAGITGPLGVFEGPLGVVGLSGKGPGIDWKREGLEVIARTSIKKFNAEFQSQAALEATILLRQENKLNGEKIDKVVVDVPVGAYEVIGGGKYGKKDEPKIKEQADHNLQYLIAVALLDGEVWPEQFTTERINRGDVQTLLQKVIVQPSTEFTLRLPQEMPARVTIFTQGKKLEREVKDYDGFSSRPMSWEQVKVKFNRLAALHADKELRGKIISAVSNLEKIQVKELTALLASVQTEKANLIKATVKP